MERIEALRKRIDEIDEQILYSLKQRVEACRTIGAVKREQMMPIKDPPRENVLCRRISEKATELGLNSAEVERIYREIVAMCTHVQEYNIEP